MEAAGGPETIESILREFYRRLSIDRLVGFFFAGRNTHTIAAKQAEFLLHSAGLCPQYTGRSPKDAHKGLPPILPGHFDRRILILSEVLKEEKLKPEHIETWIEFERRFRKQVVSRPRR